MKLQVAATALILAHVVHGNPDKLPCNRAITKGNTIMGSGVVESTSESVKLHDHNTMKSFDCGSTVACGAKLAFELSTGPTTSPAQYVIEAVASAGTSSSWGIKGGTCDGARVDYPAEPMSTTYTVPASGSVTVRVAWAKANGQVSVTLDCTCAVTCSTTTASAPTPHPPAAPTFTRQRTRISTLWRMISSICMAVISSICMALAFAVFA